MSIQDSNITSNSNTRVQRDEFHTKVACSVLSIFQTVRPIPELLIVGCGRNIHPVTPEVRQFVKSIGMKLETVDSRNAASTYNILNEEGRVVAAALLPYGVAS
ncbi:unnamed protein product [Brassica rapa]|uniref:NADH dehydrogenase [ubiquinone] 1 alpha subcomplex assembly factor 3 n=1 Tax=Brassica campestris TaxID=3711 RepID=A0A3P5Z1H3_BRACM|nr:unnamed protein product [Brassica rapa]VDC69733.1 unnamed protein product [Brassica rapa]VDC69734.1 unnamed protein product [Brassica rapa]